MDVRNRYNADDRIYTIHDRVEVVRDGERSLLEYQFDMRHFTPEEITRLLSTSGFGNIRMYGGLKMERWTQGTAERIVCADKESIWYSVIHSSFLSTSVTLRDSRFCVPLTKSESR